jgi:hypothetical protein
MMLLPSRGSAVRHGYRLVQRYHYLEYLVLPGLGVGRLVAEPEQVDDLVAPAN